MTLTLSILFFIFGFTTGSLLLSYDGTHPVNMIYFMLIAVFFPLVGMLFSLVSMGKISAFRVTLLHFSTTYWFERLLGLLPKSLLLDFKGFKLDRGVTHWLLLKRIQLLGFIFSLGLLFALLLVVITQDIAFAWSTTLQVTAEEFQYFLSLVAYPWSTWFHDAVPSLELIEQSQYFRLGERVNNEMIASASRLGEWWKFLALGTLFYAVFLRFLFYLLVCRGFQSILKSAYLRIEGVEKLLHDFSTALISTQSLDMEVRGEIKSRSTVPIVQQMQGLYSSIQGWAFSTEQMRVMNDSLGIEADALFSVGGSQSFLEDEKVLKQSHTEVLLYVKAWEPPTMDFIDYLDALSRQVTNVLVYPVGTQKALYKSMPQDVQVWKAKLALSNFQNIQLKEI